MKGGWNKQSHLAWTNRELNSAQTDLAYDCCMCKGTCTADDDDEYDDNEINTSAMRLADSVVLIVAVLWSLVYLVVLVFSKAVVLTVCWCVTRRTLSAQESCKNCN